MSQLSPFHRADDPVDANIRIGTTDYFADYRDRSPFHLGENARDVFTANAEGNQLHTSEKKHR